MLCQWHCAASTAWIGRQCQGTGDCYARSDQLERLLVFGAVFFVAAKSTRVWVPAIAGCAENPNGNVRYQLKMPYRHGTTHAIFQPLDLPPDWRPCRRNHRST